MPRLSRFIQKLPPVPGPGLTHGFTPGPHESMPASSTSRRPTRRASTPLMPHDAPPDTDLALYRSIVQQAFDGILVVGADGRVLEANPRACEMLGYAPGEMCGLDVRSVLAHDDAAQSGGLLCGLRVGDAVRIECGLLCKGGEALVADVSVKKMDDGRTQVIMRDATERDRAEKELSDLNRELERRVAERTAQLEQARKSMEEVYLEAQQAVREREELLSLVSHDLKNPLGAIKGFAQMLQRVVGRADMDEATARKLVDGLAQIDSAATRMDRLLNDQLDLARLQAGQPIELQRQPTDLAALARQVAAEYQRTTAQHRLWVVVPEEGVRGEWDAQRIERSLSNLVSNAVKYSPGGGEVEIAVEREEDEAGGHWAVCRVTDHGLGIPEQDLPRIFDWYTRAGNVAAISGTGIGLASVRQVVEQHGGAVAVHSREGEGSTFIIRLPL